MNSINGLTVGPLDDAASEEHGGEKLGGLGRLIDGFRGKRKGRSEASKPHAPDLHSGEPQSAGTAVLGSRSPPAIPIQRRCVDRGGETETVDVLDLRSCQAE